MMRGPASRPSPATARATRLPRASASASSAWATAILDSVDFARTGPVRWDEEQQAFVVPYRDVAVALWLEDHGFPLPQKIER